MSAIGQKLAPSGTCGWQPSNSLITERICFDFVFVSLQKICSSIPLFNYLPKEAAVIINLHHLDWMGGDT